jgi:hypothetical protein
MRDQRGRLLYVGITTRGMRRMREHADTQPWWSTVTRIEVTHFPGWSEARRAELWAIRTERPLHNKQDTYHWTRKGLFRATWHFFVLFVPLTTAALSVIALAVGSALSAPTMTHLPGFRVLIASATLLATTMYACDGVSILRTPLSVPVPRLAWIRCGLSGAICVALLLVVGPAPTVDLPYVWVFRALYYVAFGLVIPIQLLRMWTQRQILYGREGRGQWTIWIPKPAKPVGGLDAARALLEGEVGRRVRVLRR